MSLGEDGEASTSSTWWCLSAETREETGKGVWRKMGATHWGWTRTGTTATQPDLDGV